MLPNPVATRCGRRRIVTYKCTELGWQLMYIYNLGSKEIKHVFAEQFCQDFVPNPQQGPARLEAITV